MARISSYNQDTSVEGGDKLVGASSDGTTKTYTLDAIGKYYINNNIISVSGQQNFKFVDTVNAIGIGTMFIDGLNANATPFTLLTSLSVSKYNTQNKLIDNFLDNLFEDSFRLSSVENPDNFADIEVLQTQNHPTQENFYKITFGKVTGQGSFYKDETYTLQAVSQTDAFFIFSQEANNTVWSITHNLDKFPSVTVVDSGDNILYTEIEYINKNTLEVRFEASTSGKAYMN